MDNRVVWLSELPVKVENQVVKENHHHLGKLQACTVAHPLAEGYVVVDPSIVVGEILAKQQENIERQRFFLKWPEIIVNFKS